MKKRSELPNYKKISLEIDKDKILSVLEDNKDKLIPVSYTHLTLPTNREV